MRGFSCLVDKILVFKDSITLGVHFAYSLILCTDYYYQWENVYPKYDNFKISKYSSEIKKSHA
jgi:hypothetical protein